MVWGKRSREMVKSVFGNRAADVDVVHPSGPGGRDGVSICSALRVAPKEMST